MTEPLSAAQWQQIGWAGRECIASSKYVIDYLSRTTDGRILFGGRGAPYHFGSRLKDAYDRHAPTHAQLRNATLEWFPSVRREQFSHAWGGPLGVPRDWMPTMSLADLITETPSALTSLPTVGHTSPHWEPEPFRYLGIRYVQQGYARLDRKAQRRGTPPDGSTRVERLSRH